MHIRVFRHYLNLPILVLGCIESAALMAAVFLAALLRFHESLDVATESVGPILPRAIAFTGSVIICMVAMGLYSARQRAKAAGLTVRIATSFAAAVVLMALLAYLIRDVYMWRGWLLLSVGVGFVLIALVRFTFNRLVNEDLFKRRVLVFGAGSQASSLARLRRRTDQRGFVILGYLESGGERVAVPKEKLVDLPEGLLGYCTRNEVDEIVIAMDDRRRAFPVHELLECRLAGIEVLDLVTFFERETGKVRLDVLNPSWIIFASGFRRDTLRRFTARVFDVCASFVLLAISWPVMLIAAIAIKLEDGPRAPVFYPQKRVGLEGRHFQVLKFRSMRADAEQAGKAQWATAQDARVTRVGRYMRKTRVDELPQLINVLAGDMGFVGPRPERPEFVNELSERIPYYRERHTVKPGLTGWAQLCYPYGSSEHDALEKLQYDLYYVKNHTLLFDLMILLETCEVVLLGKGAR
jgi:sugar transferase (PEP-CTERM system associated)